SRVAGGIWSSPLRAEATLARREPYPWSKCPRSCRPEPGVGTTRPPLRVRRVRPTGRIAILGKRPLSAASPLDAALRSYNERPPELTPAIDASEAFLVAV